MIEIKLFWWYIPIILFFIPFVYMWLRGEGGDYDMGIDILLVTAISWIGAIMFTIGKIL